MRVLLFLAIFVYLFISCDLIDPGENNNGTDLDLDTDLDNGKNKKENQKPLLSKRRKTEYIKEDIYKQILEAKKANTRLYLSHK